MGNCRSQTASRPGPKEGPRGRTWNGSAARQGAATKNGAPAARRVELPRRQRPAASKTAALTQAHTSKPVTAKRPKPPDLNAATKKSPAVSSKVPAKKTVPRAVATKNSQGHQPCKSTASATSNNEFSSADPSRWKLSELKFAGAAQYATIGHQDIVKGQSIQKAIQKFKSSPSQYVAMTYQTSCLDWPVDQQQYTLIHRDGTDSYKPQNVGPKGWMTVLLHDYQRLPPFPNHELPLKHRDKYTDSMSHHRTKLHSKNNLPILPGRGMGVGDTPSLKLIGDIDPSDIKQGSVGNCWMLSGISSLAEFDGAVKKLFRKTPHLDKRPLDGPNMYTVTLWDLKTWKEVDVVVDERLCVMADGSRRLLASKPSDDGELWVCYLEKALAAHCGGWDKITGGQCTHAWAMMTGCREQYMINKTADGKYGCHAKFNPNTKKWSADTNSPHDCDGSMWRVAWPQVGGAGDADKDLDQNEMFRCLCAWDAVNFIMGASTDGTTDKHITGGMVDNHAYSVIDCKQNVAGSGIDLIRVRNPWGKQEIEDGMFDDDGPGWKRYPQIKKALNPVVADDGIFWVTKQEFFKIFTTIYLSASNMTEFLED